ncbi:MAG TPA: CHAT domain-containing protein [Nannocystis exedens]|nr:CHAT domain-containing protein [Nannocystis exedens]
MSDRFGERAPGQRGIPRPDLAKIDVDLRALSPKEKRKKVRKWSDITGITLHQTGIHGFGDRAWKKVTAHLGVHSDGRVFLIHPLESYLWSSNSLNRDTVAIEVAGNFLGDLDRPNSYWKKGGGPSELSEVMIAGLRRAIRYIIKEIAANGGRIEHVYAHRQGRGAKSNCPGAAIWINAGVWAQETLGLANGPGPNYVRKDGKPIPPEWDPRMADEPLNFAADMYAIEWQSMGAEEGVEAPDEDDLFFVDQSSHEVVAASVRIRSLPSGLTLSTAAEQGAGEHLRSRGSLDLGGPIELDSGFDLEGSQGDPLAGILDDLLGSGLSIVDTFHLEPAPAEAGAVTRGLADAPMGIDSEDDDCLDFEIVVEEEEQAIVLLEEGGAFRWVFPESAAEDNAEGVQVRGLGGGLARFRVPLRSSIHPAATDERDETRTRGFLGDLVKGAVTARVYKFFAEKIAGTALAHLLDGLENDSREGPVLIRGTELRDWLDVDDLSGEALPKDRPARVLLLVHGTFSSTRGSFGALCEGTGQELLARMLGHYDLVLGVDHRSLSRMPRENAAMIRDLLVANEWPHPPELDVICFSRGGLVARELVERLLPVSEWPATVQKVIFVATTNAGTLLARPENLHDFIDIYTTLACNVVRGLGLAAAGVVGIVAGEIVSGIGALVKALVTCGLDNAMIPGLAAMDPGGEVVRVLNRTALPAREEPAPLYYQITSCFSADTDATALLRGGLADGAKALVADRIINQLYGGVESDLVVHNPSTATLHPDFRYSGHLHFDANPAVYHVNFFVQEPVHHQLTSWLELDQVEIGGDDLEFDIDLDFDLGSIDTFADDAFSLREVSFGIGDGEEGDEEDDELVDLGLRAVVPAEVSVGEVFRVDIDITRGVLAESLADNVARTSASARALASAEEQLEIEVLPRSGLRTIDHLPIVLGVPQEGAKIGLFVELCGDEIGVGCLWVLARQGGRAIARIVLEVSLVATGSVQAAAKVVAAAQAAYEDPGGGPSLEIIELRGATGLRYRYQLQAPALGLGHRFESALLHGAVEDVVSGLYTRIESEWKQAAGEPKRFDRRLRALGVQLGEQLFPRELRAMLWEHRKGLQGLSLLSDEGHIPWELVHLKHPDKPLKASESCFLAELGMVRKIWGSVPASQIVVRGDHAFTVVPNYPVKALALPSAAIEQRWLEQRMSTAALDPDPDVLLERLETPGSIDLLHIAAHGEIADREAWLILEGEVRSVGEGSKARRKWFPARLAASEVAASADLRGPQGERALVFINACKVARAEHLLSGFAGWAPSFLGAGAGAVVAPLWSVGDGAAMRFAEGFYSALLAGASFSVAAKLARERARKLGDPTWLAYVVYAAANGHMIVQQAGNEQGADS